MTKQDINPLTWAVFDYETNQYVSLFLLESDARLECERLNKLYGGYEVIERVEQ